MVKSIAKELRINETVNNTPFRIFDLLDIIIRFAFGIMNCTNKLYNSDNEYYAEVIIQNCVTSVIRNSVFLK